MLMDELMQCDLCLCQMIDNLEFFFKVLSDGMKQFNVFFIIDIKYCIIGYYVMKYYFIDFEQWNIGQFILDVFIFCYVEVLLNYVEVKVELGECIQEVLDQIVNELRDCVEMLYLKVNVGFIDLNWLDYGYEFFLLFYEICCECVVELVGEGFCWDDIVCWKVGKLLEVLKSMFGMKVLDKLKEQYDFFFCELMQDNLLIVYLDRIICKWDDKFYLYLLFIDEIMMNLNLLFNNFGWE